jgi:hypothetical protein
MKERQEHRFCKTAGGAIDETPAEIVLAHSDDRMEEKIEASPFRLDCFE